MTVRAACPCGYAVMRSTEVSARAALTLHNVVSHSGGTPIVAQDTRK